MQGIREKFVQGVRRSIPGPQALSGAMRLNHFCPIGVDLHLKVRGITIYGIELGPMKNTTRHEIGLNPARWSGAEPRKL